MYRKRRLRSWFFVVAAAVLFVGVGPYGFSSASAAVDNGGCTAWTEWKPIQKKVQVCINSSTSRRINGDAYVRNTGQQCSTCRLRLHLKVKKDNPLSVDPTVEKKTFSIDSPYVVLKNIPVAKGRYYTQLEVEVQDKNGKWHTSRLSPVQSWRKAIH
jgi:hypothetical protein